jgi:hypothetical protein
MRIGGWAALALAGVLGGCGQGGGTGWNPLNWFSAAPREVTMAPAPPGTDDPRPLVAQVLSMTVEPTPGGAVLRATGLPPTQGWWAAQLLPDPSDDANAERLSFRFVVVPPPGPTRVSTPPSREITAGVFLSNRQLEGVREITVIGAGGARSSRR